MDRLFRRTIVFALAIIAASASAFADPPGRVARISFVTGSVSYRPASVDGWADAPLNYPLTIGDHIWNDASGRAELELGAATIRLAPYTEFSILNLDDRAAQLRITQGAMTVRVVASGPESGVEIDTPGGAVSLLQPGFYRVDVNDTGDTTTVTVRRGEADVDSDAGAFAVRANESVRLAGIDRVRVDTIAAVGMDSFEDWCLARDRRAENAASTRYVSPDLIGYDDLDQYGTWREVADYGPVWVPRVRAEWVPYRDGRWLWVDPWGWTWIDEEPWGFAPFHYGRWAHLNGVGWSWIPGARVARPVYAPALVAFVGGSGWRASLAIGSEPVAWFPLGPREVYVPAYRVSPAYVTAVNRPHVVVNETTNVNVTTVTYVNRTVPGAVTAVSRETFVRAQPVARAAVAVPRESVQTAQVVGHTPPVQPDPRVSRTGEAPRRAAAPPPAAVNRPVVARTPPPATAAAAPPVRQVAPRSAEPANRRESQPAPTSGVRPAPQPPAEREVPRAQPQQPVRPPQPQAAPPPPQPSRPAPPPESRPVPPPEPRPAPPQPQAAPPAQPRPAEREAPRAQPQQPPPPQPPSADLAARHAQERAQLDARHAAERAEMAARHQQEEQRATDARQRQEIKQQHQAEAKAAQERQKQERDAVQKRQQEEKKRKGD